MKKILQPSLFRLSFMALLWGFFSIQVAQAQCATTWASRTSAADNTWNSVTYGNGLYVAVAGTGAGNRVMTSPDGVTWTSRSSAADNSWTSVTYGNGLFVATASSGTGNRVMTSLDGINWTSRSSAADNSWLGITYGNGLFVAVAWDGTNRVMTSPDGITWTSRTSAAANGWTAITYGNGVFVAVANTGTGNRVMTSPDGITWTSSTTAVNNNWCGVTYGNGVFVAVAPTGTGNRVMTSPDGITWTSRSSAADNGWTSVTYGNGLFVAVSLTGTGNRVMTSPDGITWTSRSSAVDNGWQFVGYGNNLFVAVSLNGTGNRVMTSSPFNKATAASTTPILCINTALTNITHTTTGATGIGTATGLPTGVSASWAANTITISGTPTASGIFNYTIPLTGGCGTVSATGTITVNSPPTFTSFGSASTTMGSNLVITGTNLTGVTSVRFGETPALFTVNSNTQITATVPRVANTGKVSLSNGVCSALSTSITVNKQSTSNILSRTTPAIISWNGISISGGVYGWSAPTFTDLDADGLLDMIIGEYDGNLNHYEQNAANSTSFTLITENFNGIDVGGRSKPTFTDLDGDGLLDMIVGEIDGNLNHYEQNAANSTSFTLINANFNGINGIMNSAPTFTDLDGDGLLDLIVGTNGDPSIYHYEQNAANSTNFTLIPNSSLVNDFRTLFGIVILDGGFYTPTFTDLDGDGLLDLIGGETWGRIWHMEQNAANSTSFTVSNTIQGSQLDGPEQVAAPAFTDLDGDGLLDMIVGKFNGNLSHWEQNQLPIISSLSVNAVCQNATVSITGTALTGATSVTINGTTVGTLSGVTDTNITFTVPSNATSGNVVVTTPSGTSNAVALTVSPNMTVTTASTTPTLCINTALTNITHTTTGATGIGTATGLPAGVTAAWAANTITISGTPTTSGIYNYTIPLTGGCATVNATGTITVSNVVAGVISGDGTVCIGNLTNIAIGKPAIQSSTWNSNYLASKAVDGNTNGNSGALSISHTVGYRYDWWQVDLTSINAIHSIKLWNRTDVNAYLLSFFYIMTSSSPFASSTPITNNTDDNSQILETNLNDPNVSSTYVATPPMPSQEYPINKNARYVRIQRNGYNWGTPAYLHIAEVQVFSKVKTLSVTGAVGAIQWEKSTDNINWTPIAQANASSYNAPTDVAGTFYYHTVVTNGACSATSPSAILTVINTVGAASSTPTLCINSPLTNITHTTTSATGISAAVGLPAGVTATWANNVITISGTPTASGIFNYTIPLTGGCGTMNATGTITVNTNTASAASSTPSLCINAALSNITHTTTSATGIGTVTGLPAGVTAAWASNTITISGTPTASGTFSYSIPLTGGCGSVNATGTITVNTNKTASAASSTPSLCINTPLTNITHTTAGATGIGTAIGLPTGVTAAWAANTITISGTPTASGTFNYSIPLTGGCGTVNATGTITVNTNTASAASSTPTLCVNTAFTNITHSTTGATGILSPNPASYSLPPAVTNPTVDEDLGNVTISLNGSVVLNNTTPINSLSGTIGTASGAAGSYANFTAFGPYNMYPGSTYTFSLSSITTGASYNNAMAIYIDYNRNGIFTDAGEQVYTASALTAGAHTETGTFTIPTSALSGVTRMRVICNSGALITSPTQSVYWGEYEEYSISMGGIKTNYGLPAGVTAAWANNTITISGMPTASGTFSYAIPLTGGCGTVNATGTITVAPAVTASAATSTPTLCINTPLTNINHTTEGATGIGTATGLPAGVTAAWANNTITISGTPTEAGMFNYSIPLTGGCRAVSATGTITVTPNMTAGTASTTPTLCINTALTNITHITTGATGIATATGLPAGVTAAWANNTITISGTPTVSGTFNYSVPLTGGCGSVNATGTITVNDMPSPPTITGDVDFCAGSATNLSAGVVSSRQYAATVLGFSSEYTSNCGPWSSCQLLGAPNVYPNYGDIAQNWANASPTRGLEYLNLGFSNPTPISYVDIYETYSVGSVTQVSVKNNTTGLYEVVYNATAAPAPGVARILHITFPLTNYDVSAVRIDMDTALFGTWIEIDAVAIGVENPNTYLWSNGATTPSIEVSTAGDYTVTVTNAGGCSATSAIMAVTVNALPVIPTITASGSTTLCQGGNVTLSGLALPLNTVNGATLAIGLRKLKSTYTGPALHLRRSSDNQEQDFGFVGNDLDTAAISIWLDGADGFCTTVYDQSGNGGNVTQSDISAQPIYVAAGINNKPTLHFNTTQFMDNSVNYPAPFSAIYGARVTGMSSRLLSSKYNNWLLGYWNGSMDMAYFEGWLNNGIGTQANNSYTIYAGTGNGNVSTLYKNGTQLYSDNGGVEGPNGIRLNGSGQWGELSDCDFTDVMVFGSELSSQDIAKLNTSISDYYSTNNTSSGALSYVWSNGATTPSIEVSTAGDYMVTVTNAGGCSATSETTSVTVNHPTTETTVATSCGMYIWEAGNYSDYFESGTYSYTENCVTHILELTVIEPTTETTVATSCGMYVWETGNNSDYFETGTYSYTENCVTHILELTVIEPTTETTVAASCDNYTWSAKGETYTTSGTYTSVLGCVTRQLVLTINNSRTEEETVTGCDSYAWANTGTTYTVSGDYPGDATTDAVTGCTVDHILHLTINTSSVYYADTDGDGYGNASSSTNACSQPTGYAAVGGDCNDAVAAVNPGQTEILYNGIDDNCDGQFDEGSQATSVLQTVSCGQTLTSMGSLIYATINLNATAYRFKVVNNNTGDIQYVDNTHYWFALNWLASYEYATAYTVSVQLQIAGVWVGYYGSSCVVNSPDITSSTGTLQLVSTQCGATLPSIGTIIYTTAQSGATGYRFRITDVTPNATGSNLVQVKERSYHWFGLTMLTRYNYGSTYMVEVAVKTTGGYTGYGSPCYINTPASPMLNNCGAVIPTSRTLVYTAITKSVTQYRFQVTRVSDQSSRTFDTGRFWFSFKVNMPGYTPSVPYSVRVAVMTAGTWSPFGDSCEITSPAIARTDGNAQLDFTANVFPNPYTDQFNLLVNTDSDERISYKVYDMLGKLIEADEFDYTALETKEFGRNYPAGVYNIIVSQGEEVKTLRVIKR